MATFNREVMMIGVGGFGRSWVTRFSEREDQYSVVDIADVSPDALSAAGDPLGVTAGRRWTDWASGLAATSADLVVIVTPPAVHCEQTVAALEAGKHVILAKPMAPTWDECVRMVEAAGRADRVFSIEQNYRYYPENQQFKGVIRDDPGEVGEVDAEFFINADFGADDFRTSMAHPLTLDMMIHHADLLRYFTGLDAEWVVAAEYNPPWSWYRHAVALRMLIGLSNGAVASYRGCWASGGASTNWSGNWRCQMAEGRTLLRTGGRIELWESGGWGRDPKMTPVEYTPEQYRGEDCLSEVTDAILSDRPSATDGRDNLKSIGVVLAAAESARAQGRKAAVPRWEPPR